MKRIKDLLWKLGVLRNLLGSAWAEWKEEIWKHDPDEVICCIPSIVDPCGCMAMTIRETYTPMKEPSE